MPTLGYVQSLEVVPDVASHDVLPSPLEVLEKRMEKIEEVQRQMAAILNETHLDYLAAELSEIQKWRSKMDAFVVSKQTVEVLHFTDNSGIPASTLGVAQAGNEFPRNQMNSYAERSAEGKVAADKKKREYDFQESVYDAAFFIFTEYLTMSCNISVCVSLMLNMVLQIGVIYITQDQFNDEPFPKIARDRFSYWRASQGHSIFTADPLSGTSLAARVCAGDEALSIADYQMATNDVASVYLDGGKGEFLCNVSVMFWALRCAWELRRALNFIVALCNVPWVMNKGSTISMDDHGSFKIIDLHVRRVAIGFLVALCRMYIALHLMYAGSRWLAYTKSVEDLLLNASALGFALDVDETIFGVMSPLMLIGLINSVRAMKLPAKRTLILIPFVLCIGTFVFVCVVNLTYISTLTDRMEQVHEILCSKQTNIDVITGTNALGWMFFAKSTPIAEKSDEMQSLIDARAEATKYIIDRDQQAELVAQDLSVLETSQNQRTSQNFAQISKFARMPLEIFVASSKCMDIPWDPGATEDAKLGARLWVATGNRTLRKMQTCAEVKEHCRGSKNSLLAQNVRLMCPITCGCTDPTSGLWDLATNAAGCPQDDCRVQFGIFQGFPEYLCRDRSVIELNASGNWHMMLTHMYAAQDIDDLVSENLTVMGCEAFQYLDFFTREHLCGLDWIIDGRSVKLGAGLMCPESCGCVYNYTPSPLLPEGARQYIPGEFALCPMKACAVRYEISYLQWLFSDLGNNSDAGGDHGGDDGGDGGGDGGFDSNN